MRPPRSQPVTSPLTSAAIFVIATINDGAEAAVHDALTGLSGLGRAVGFRTPASALAVVTSIGSDAWDRLFSGPRPAGLHPFPELRGARHHAPSTPGDLLFHIRAGAMDVCFEMAGQIMKSLDGAVTVVDEVHGFKFYENRDLLGFVDGTENPDGPDARDRLQALGVRGGVGARPPAYRARAHADRRGPASPHVAAFLGVPLYEDGKLCGVLCADRAHPRRARDARAGLPRARAAARRSVARYREPRRSGRIGPGCGNRRDNRKARRRKPVSMVIGGKICRHRSREKATKH